MGTLRADGPRTVAVVRKDGSVEADRSVGFRNITVVGVVGRVAFGFLYQSAVARINDVPYAPREDADAARGCGDKVDDLGLPRRITWAAPEAIRMARIV